MALAYFITFSTYGTWLHGAEKGLGSVDRQHNIHGTPFVEPGLPAGVTYDANSGLISGTIAENAASATPYIVTLMGTDTNLGVSSSLTFTWMVNPPSP